MAPIGQPSRPDQLDGVGCSHVRIVANALDRRPAHYALTILAPSSAADGALWVCCTVGVWPILLRSRVFLMICFAWRSPRIWPDTKASPGLTRAPIYKCSYAGAPSTSLIRRGSAGLMWNCSSAGWRRSAGSSRPRCRGGCRWWSASTGPASSTRSSTTRRPRTCAARRCRPSRQPSACRTCSSRPCWSLPAPRPTCVTSPKVVLVPLPPAIGRAIDRAVGDRTAGPILLNRAGTRMTATPPPAASSISSPWPGCGCPGCTRTVEAHIRDNDA
jgi:hypothetical protein